MGDNENYTGCVIIGGQTTRVAGGDNKGGLQKCW